MKNARTIVGPCCDVPFGEILRRACAQLGVTQKQLAKHLGVTQCRVSEVFASESITEQLLDRYVAALGIVLEVRVKV